MLDAALERDADHLRPADEAVVRAGQRWSTRSPFPLVVDLADLF